MSGSIKRFITTDEKGNKSIILDANRLEELIESVLPDGLKVVSMGISQRDIECNGEFLDISLR